MVPIFRQRFPFPFPITARVGRETPAIGDTAQRVATAPSAYPTFSKGVTALFEGKCDHGIRGDRSALKLLAQDLAKPPSARTFRFNRKFKRGFGAVVREVIFCTGARSATAGKILHHNFCLTLGALWTAVSIL